MNSNHRQLDLESKNKPTTCFKCSKPPMMFDRNIKIGCCFDHREDFIIEKLKSLHKRDDRIKKVKKENGLISKEHFARTRIYSQFKSEKSINSGRKTLI